MGRHRRYILCMMSVLLLLANRVSAQTEEEEIPLLLQAQLRCSHTHMLPGEPLWLTFTLKNAGGTATTIVRCAPPGSDYLSYEIANPGKQPRTYRPTGFLIGTGMPKRMITLSPGDTFSRSDDLTVEKNAVLLNEPGEYFIHAYYSLPDGVPGGPKTIRSNGISIVVEPPVGEDKAVYESLVTNVAGKVTNKSIWSADPIASQAYEAIIRTYPHSRYTPYVHHYLAQSYEFDAKQSKRGQPEAVVSLRKAIDHYLAASESMPDDPFKSYIYQLTGRVYASLRDNTNALALYEKAFCSTGTTAEQQLEIIGWIRHLELGTFYSDTGLVKPGESITTRVTLPLLPYALALGYTLTKDVNTGESVVMKGAYQWNVTPGDDPLPVCGTLCRDMRVELDTDGAFLVSPSVIAMLFAERYGKDMARQLSFILTRAR